MDSQDHTPGPEKLTVVKAAARIGVHPVTVSRAARAGELPAVWSFGKRLIDPSDLDRWLAARQSAPPRRQTP